MSKYFDTLRTPLTVTARGKSHTYFIRELGYNHFAQLTQTAGIGLSPSGRALAVLQEVAVASIEEESGKKSYTKQEWLDEIREVSEQLAKAVMVAQGIDPEATNAEISAEDEAKNS